MVSDSSRIESLPGRRERRKADTRRRLLAAARVLFVEKGYDATRPQDIAQAADVDPELIAHGTLGFIHSALVHASGRSLDRRSVLDDLERFLVRALVVRRPDAPSEKDS